MTILAIDTSTDRGSVALLRDGTPLLDETFMADRSHSATLFTVLERVRALTETIDAIAIGIGPGSFAGVRIAISAAIGFQLALGSRVVGIPSVAALETNEPRYCAIGDARRDTFYFTRVEDGRCADGPRLVSADELRASLAQREGWPVLALGPIALLPDTALALPVARRLAELAALGVGIVAEGALEPLYLREPHITQPKTQS